MPTPRTSGTKGCSRSLCPMADRWEPSRSLHQAVLQASWIPGTSVPGSGDSLPLLPWGRRSRCRWSCFGPQTRPYHIWFWMNVSTGLRILVWIYHSNACFRIPGWPSVLPSSHRRRSGIGTSSRVSKVLCFFNTFRCWTQQNHPFIRLNAMKKAQKNKLKPQLSKKGPSLFGSVPHISVNEWNGSWKTRSWH